MKVLTDEAKIHLACEVDDWKVADKELCKTTGLYKPGVLIAIEDYNPNQFDSPYWGKDLKGILIGLIGTDAYSVIKGVDFTLVLSCSGILLKSILDVTGFKGRTGLE